MHILPQLFQIMLILTRFALLMDAINPEEMVSFSNTASVRNFLLQNFQGHFNRKSDYARHLYIISIQLKTLVELKL